MSTYTRKTKHPKTGKWEHATWVDDAFGKHHYGVRFPSEPETLYDPWKEELEVINHDPDHANKPGLRLYVDDQRKPPEGWAVARTIGEAIRFIELYEPMVVSLDHDISIPVDVGGVSRPYPSNECFCSVARFLVAFSSETYMPNVYIHTANPNGARNMERILSDGGVLSVYTPSAPSNGLEK